MPKLIIKTFKKTYFKTNFIVSLVVIFDKRITDLLVINFKRIVFNLDMCYSIVHKQQYFNFLLENMSFVKYFDIRPEFFRWQEKLGFTVAFKNYNKMDYLLKNVMIAFLKLYV